MGGLVSGLFGGGGGGGGTSFNPWDYQEMLRHDAAINRINQTTPYGSLEFTGPNRNQLNLELSPQIQALLDTQVGFGTQAGDMAQGLLSAIPGSSEAAQSALLSRLNPSLQMEQDQLRSRLENSGNPAAYGGNLAEGSFNELSLLNQKQNDARMAALLAGPQYQNQLIQGAGMLANASPFAVPQYQFQGGTPANTGAAASLMGSLNQAQQSAQASNTSSMLGGLFDLGTSAIGAGLFGGGTAAGSMFGTLGAGAAAGGGFGSITPFMAAAAPIFSDRRLKTDIHRVGIWKGLGAYLYRYIFGGGWYLGVMADEVADRYPAAVTVGPGGYLMVDYNLLRRAV